MKSFQKRFLALVLAISCTVCLAGCGAADPKPLNEKVVQMLGHFIAHDIDGAYAMFYPDVTDRNTFTATMKSSYAYFPITEGYSYKLLNFESTKSITGNAVTIYQGQYKIEFDGRVFYGKAVWRSDTGGSGFTNFQIVSEEDRIAAQKKET
ncbi:MAG: hypothetical protein IJK86_02280 [Lachnospiraceae bacterium]|nr:hypothetical protein [Lachnospiraceae bacterium]